MKGETRTRPDHDKRGAGRNGRTGLSDEEGCQVELRPLSSEGLRLGSIAVDEVAS